jgi:trans-aconitate 2-methyltransferase
MTDWNPKAYLKYEKERNIPALDLARRIEHDHPETILDVGCGPGNSTEILFSRWQGARITAIDNSPAMLEKARQTNPRVDWVLCDATQDLSFMGKFDIIFSNATLQWIPRNDLLISKLFAMLNPGGVLAAQIPFVKEMLLHQILIDISQTPQWVKYFKDMPSFYFIYSPDYYYDALCDLSSNIQLWETRYFHIMNGFEDLLYWYESTGIRPYLERLPEEKLRAEFENQLLIEIMKYYPPNKDGKILFPFPRIFFTVYKQD